jgi:hypothetical protein
MRCGNAPNDYLKGKSIGCTGGDGHRDGGKNADINWWY